MTERRPYRLGKRSASVAATKIRILEAATTEFANNGIENTSMQSVARRADVAAGTVLYHYPTPNELVAATLEQWMELIDPPAPSTIDATAPPNLRVRQLVRALYDFYVRSGWAYQIYEKSPNNPIMAAARDDWDRSFEELMTVALGEHAAQPDALRLISIFVDPAFHNLLLSRGLDQDEAVDLATMLALDRVPDIQN
ncbi:MAG: TetR/AcrR family transcriptional regulator [Acidimicrobiia bacterium]